MILAASIDSGRTLEVLRAGASGYVPKRFSEKQLAIALHKVVEGKIALNRELSNEMIRWLADRGKEEATNGVLKISGDDERSFYSLTSREIQVLELLALGYTNAQIANEFGIETGTVKSHVEHIIAKLGVVDRTSAVVLAIAKSIIKLPNIH